MATLKSGWDTTAPMSVTEAPTGELYFANGVDDPLRWDGQTAAAETAGIAAPTSAITIGSSGSGTIWGDYSVYVRFLDDENIPSNFSPVSSTSITSGAKITTFSYSAIPVSSDSRVTQREIWRNTYGQNVTWYRDVLLSDNTATTSSSTRTDGALITCSSLRYLTEEGYPNANRFGQPPSHMAVVASYQDRLWYAVLVDYTQGEGEDDRNAVYFSEAGEPESFPLNDDGDHVNRLILQDDGDYLLGLMPMYSYLFLLKKGHIYRLSTAGDPRNDAAVSLVAERGCINNRCWTRVEGTAFLLDRQGIYAFDGVSTKPISGAIQDYFRGRITWSQSKWFHAAHSPDEEVVRFFVCLDGASFPQHALCFHYRLNEWWEEEYPFELGASATCPIQDEPRLIAGADEHVVLMNEGVLDGPAPWAQHRWDELGTWPDGTIQGTVTSATPMTITDSGADYTFTSWFSDPGVIGSMLTVIASDGSKQSRRIAEIDTTNLKITVLNPFHTTPSAGDTYIIGGINWEVQLGAWQYVELESANQRTIRVDFEPLTETTTLDVRRYHNHSGTPDSYALTYSDKEGVNYTRNSPNAVVDLTRASGSVDIAETRGLEGSQDSPRFVEVQLRGCQGKEKIQLYRLSIDGVTDNK